MSTHNPIKVIDRKTGESFEESILGEKWIRWAYQDNNSKFLDKMLFQSALISKLMGLYYDSSVSKSKIKPVIQELEIDESEFKNDTDTFQSFNDFFARHLKTESRPFSPNTKELVSPADGRVLVFPKIDTDTYAPVKGYPFSIQKLLPKCFEQFQNGALVIVRLCPADYHRYHFPCDGKITNYAEYTGHLHSVNPIALATGKDIFGENKRALTLLETKEFASIAYMEIGAFGVGSIVNSCTTGSVNKMDEKGFFKFGGSTVLLLFEENKITFSDDLVLNSANNFETMVKVGETIGRSTH